MKDLIWSDQWLVGIGKMDEDHLDLFDLILELNSCLVRNKDEKEVLKIFGRFVKAAAKHFAVEEKYMNEYHYPHLETHIQKHRELLLQADELQRKFKTELLNVTDDITFFLRNWLIHHITLYDQALAKHLKKHGVV